VKTTGHTNKLCRRSRVQSKTRSDQESALDH